MYPAEVATHPPSAYVSVTDGTPVQLEVLYSLTVPAPLGFYPPVTVASSAMVPPTVAVAGCWVVLMTGVRVTPASMVKSVVGDADVITTVVRPVAGFGLE